MIKWKIDFPILNNGMMRSVATYSEEKSGKLSVEQARRAGDSGLRFFYVDAKHWP